MRDLAAQLRCSLRTLYEIAVSSEPDFLTSCTVAAVATTYWVASADPAVGETDYYLVRPAAPNVGSWGEDSAGTERLFTCP